MTEPQTKKCEVCGEIKPLADFSKSYRNRCKPCVAEMRRKSRIVSDMTRKPNDSEYKKARIKQTGEVVEVRPLGFHAKCNIPIFGQKIAEKCLNMLCNLSLKLIGSSADMR